MQKYQGDVSIIAIEKLPEIELKKLSNNGLVVAEGEATGHKHLLRPLKEAEIEWGIDINGFYLKVDKGEAILEHPEHKEITISEGLYFIGHQFEYDEIAERRVSD